ncbi:MAG: hypothetical protein ABWZ25_15685 [Chitinophagaceae bacterium]
MKNFGSWLVSEKGIEWGVADGGNKFSIPVAELTAIQKEDETMYKWLVAAMDEEWISVEDLYDLNYAFVYACGKLNVDFDYDILESTLDYQFDSMDMDDDDNNYDS